MTCTQTWPAPCPRPVHGPPPQPRPRRRKVGAYKVCWALRSREKRRCELVVLCPLMTPSQDSTQAAASLEERLRGRFSLAGKSKKEDGVKVDKRKRDSSTQPPKPSRTTAGGRSSQQPTTPQQAPPGQPPAAAFIAHKEIKFFLWLQRECSSAMGLNIFKTGVLVSTLPSPAIVLYIFV